MERDVQYIDEFEKRLHDRLWSFLQEREAVDVMEPDCTDFEDVWQSVCQSYLPDGVREFEGYATVSVGWMMYVGMALAIEWDSDWEKTLSRADLYLPLRDARGYDNMDEYISEDVLGLDAEGEKALAKMVGEMARMAVHALQSERFEAGSPLAFHAYVRVIHQMYLMGVSVQLFRLGYKMRKM